MMRILRSALFELAGALRSRRALVLVVLYLAASLLSMNGAITALGKMEDQLAEVLQVEKVEGKSGIVSATLWKSKQFQKIVHGLVGDSPVYEDLVGRHPAELLYALIVFLCVPLITVIASCRRVAEDVKSGAAKYALLRVTRLEWSAGKYLGLALMMLTGLLIGAVAAWCVAACRLSGADLPALFPAMLMWSVKAWFLSLAWLGVALGISHVVKSGAVADALSFVSVVVFAAVPALIKYYASGPVSGRLQVLIRLFPSSATDGLWRASFAPVAGSAVWLVALGLFWMSLGFAYFAGRDVR